MMRSRGHVGDAKLVVVGVSTGGPVALAKLLACLPGSFPLPVLVVQHMPALFTAHFAEQLDGRCAVRVREAGDRDPVVPRQVLIAPGGRHMVLDGGSAMRVLLNDAPPVRSCRPSVDVLFHSACHVLAGQVVAVVLTGMGCDGLDGCRALHAAGATIMAQDQASSVVWGMPGAVIKAGLASVVGDPEELGRMLANWLAPRSKRSRWR